MKAIDTYNKIIPRAFQKQLEIQALSPTIISAAANLQRVNRDIQTVLLPTYLSVYKHCQEINTALLPTYLSAYKHCQEINTALLPTYLSAAANWQIISNDLQNTLSSMCSPLYQLHDFLNTIELKTCAVIEESDNSQTSFIANEIQTIQKCEKIIDIYLSDPIKYFAPKIKNFARKNLVACIFFIVGYLGTRASDYVWDYLFKKDTGSKQIVININNTFIVNQDSTK